jgi:hypothetical protein
MTRSTLFRHIQLVAFALSMIAYTLALQAQASSQTTPSLEDQLAAQYPLARITSQGGCSITNPDTSLALQKPGLGALPAKTYSPMCAMHYKDGGFKTSGFKCKYWLNMSKQEPVNLQKGDRVFPTKLEVGKDELKIAVGYCSGDPPQATAYKAEIVVEFTKDFLKTASVPQVEDKIAEVLTADNGGDQQQSQQSGSSAPAQQTGQTQPANNPPPAQGSNCNVDIGFTVPQVVSVCGNPANQSKGAGTKLIYFYDQPKLKVVFVNGKVTDIE